MEKRRGVEEERSRGGGEQGRGLTNLGLREEESNRRGGEVGRR